MTESPQALAAGDHIERAFLGATPTAQTAVYTVPAEGKLVVREVRFVNTTGGAITGELWAGGFKIEPGISVPGGESRRDTSPGLVLEAEETLEARASGAGLNLYVFGVLEISA